MKARIERIWAHLWGCMAVVTSDERPETCPKCEGSGMSDLGYRVGFNEATYAYYSTLETARKDPRA